MTKTMHSIRNATWPDACPLPTGKDRITFLETGTVLVAAFLMFWIGARLIVLRLNFPIWDPYVATLVAAALTYAFRIKIGCPSSRGLMTAPYVALCFIATVFVFATFWSGYTLPAHDPIAVPSLANVIIAGHLPIDVYPSGSFAYAYPPGQPLLLSALHPLFGPVERLFVFKVVVLATVAFLPAAWSLLHYRLFPTKISPLYLFTASYLTFFGIERTMLFALPFAGKNALIFGIFMLPFVVIYCTRMSISRFGWIGGGLAIFGLTLISYSLLHMTAALLGSYSALGLALSRLRWRQVVSMTAMGAVAAGLMLAFLQEALFDPRAGEFTVNFTGLLDILKVLLARTSFMVIYAEADFGIPGFPFRGLVLIAAAMLSIYAARKRELPSLLHAAATYGSAIIIIMMFGFSVLPAGLSLDYMRWILWPVHAQLLVCAASACWFLLAAKNNKIRYTLASLASVLALTLAILDARVYGAINTAQAIERDDIISLVSVLNSENGSCGVIAESSSMPQALVTVQQSKLLDYVEAVTDCQYLNGSWVQPGVEEGRAENGFPSAKAIRSLPPQTDVFLVAFQPRMAEYRDILSAQGLNVEWESVGSISGFPVWKYETK